jgi:hypothetical protein
VRLWSTPKADSIYDPLSKIKVLRAQPQPKG